MKKSFLFLIISFLLSGLFSTNQLHALHQYTGGLSYKCLDSTTHTYEVTYIFYRDCYGINAPSVIFIDYNNTNSCAPPSSRAAQRTQILDLSIVCDTVSPCQVPSALGIGIEKHTYLDTVILDPNCGTWTLSVSSCCRSAALTNINNGSGTPYYYEQKITPRTPYNQSVVFANEVPYIATCNGFNTFNINAFDGDGDSLRYQLVDVPISNSTTVTYVNGYSGGSPMLVAPGTVFELDSMTGQISYTPDSSVSGQVALVGVAINEIRNGIVINTTIRELLIVVLDCSQRIQLDSLVTTENYTSSFGQPHRLFVCPNQTVSFRVYFNNYSSTGKDSIQYDAINSTVLPAFPSANVSVGYPDTSNVGRLAIDIQIPNATPQNFALKMYEYTCFGMAERYFPFEILTEILPQDVYETACDSFSWRGQDYFQSGVYRDTLVASTGCDSIIQLNLTIDTLQVDTSVVVRNGTQLWSNQPQLFSTRYQWGRCQNGTFLPINGATRRGYVATTNGSYAVQIRGGNSCVRTSNCYPIIITNQSEIQAQNYWQIYPNPTQGSLYIEAVQEEKASLQLFDQLGRRVITKIMGTKREQLDLSFLASGVYYLSIETANTIEQIKVVKE
jgi:hypothetical protein